MIKELSKDLKGKTIYGEPTGNNARYDSGNPVAFEVVSVGRKYMELKRVGWMRTDKYNISGATQSEVNAGYGCNSGYNFFLTMEELEESIALRAKLREVELFFISWSGRDLSPEEINIIHEIISKHEA